MTDPQEFEAALSDLISGKEDRAYAAFSRLSQADPSDLDNYLGCFHLKRRFYEWAGPPPPCGFNSRSTAFPRCYFHNNIKEVDFEKIAMGMCGRRKKNNKGKIKVGYISVDFLSHSCGIPLLDLMRCHDRERFEIVAYSFAYPWNTSIDRSAFDRYFDLYGFKRNLDDFFEAQACDVVIDATRNILDSPLRKISVKPAPLFISGWGYGDLRNHDCFDYYLGDRNFKDGKNPVKLLELPFYHPFQSFPSLNRSLNEDRLLVGTFNTCYKLPPELFCAWMEAIQEFSSSFLVMLEPCEAAKRNLKDYCVKHALDYGKIVFWPRVGRQEHLERLNGLSLILDVPYMGGGSSLVDGLRTATPVMTLEGNDLEDSGGSSILRNLDLECFAADDPADLKNLLREFLGNKRFRSELSSKLETGLGKIRNTNQHQSTISEFETRLLSLM